MAFSISAYDLPKIAEEGFEFEVTHPDTGEGLGGFIKVRGSRSKTLQAFSRKKINEQLRQEQAQKAKGGKVPVQTYEDLEETLVERAVLSIISWREITETVDGVEVQMPFTKERATQLLTDQPWLRDQVLEFSNSSERFRDE